MKYLRIHNITIHINHYKNRFINECARKIKDKIPESHSFRVFFVRCRRTYVLKNLTFSRNISLHLSLNIKEHFPIRYPRDPTPTTNSIAPNLVYSQFRYYQLVLYL